MFGTLFRNRVFVDDQVKMSSLGWALIPHDYVLTKTGEHGNRKGHAHR